MTPGEQIIYKLKREIWESKEAGEKHGKEIGEKLGKENEQQRIAKSMKESQLATDVIAKCTGLTAEQIEKL